jgi:Flp pilus assembly protein TadG
VSWFRGRDQRGASAVEFALVMPLLFAITFGIMDWGLWFTNSINMRQGVREAARQMVVTCAATSGPCQPDMNQWVPVVKTQVGAITGTTTVRILYPATGWKKGSALTVCAVVSTTGLTGFTPMPDNGKTKAVVQMSIESDQTGMTAQTAPADPTGASWSWCG